MCPETARWLPEEELAPKEAKKEKETDWVRRAFEDYEERGIEPLGFTYEDYQSAVEDSDRLERELLDKYNFDADRSEESLREIQHKVFTPPLNTDETDSFVTLVLDYKAAEKKILRYQNRLYEVGALGSTAKAHGPEIKKPTPWVKPV